MSLHIFESPAELNEKLIAYVIEIATNAIDTKGRFDFVLTGGNSPKELYRQLSTTYRDKIDWSKVFFFFGDERNVLPDHKDYNGLMARESLFNNLQTPADHIFYIDTTMSPKNAALAYQSALIRHFGLHEVVFDLILLGMGDDAHTASIFPGTTLVDEKKAGIDCVFVDKLDTYRISFTAPLINKAKHVAFITFGENKAKALSHVLEDESKNYSTYPAQLINPINGSLDWFVDQAAASLLKK